MGGGDLNLKKSWHPSTFQNLERVWKAESRHDAEEKKITQLQQELREERAREEVQRTAEDTGVVRKRDQRVEWLYSTVGAGGNREEYLLGKKVDKQVDPLLQDQEREAEELASGPGALFVGADAANSVADISVKIREDPLFLIKQREEEARKKIANNPVKLKQLAQLVSKEKKGRKHKKAKKHHHRRRHSSSSEEGSHDQSHDKWRERSPVSHSHRRRSPDPRRHHSRSPDPRRHHSRSPDTRRRRSRSPDTRRFRSRSPDTKRHHSRSPDPRRHNSRSPDTRRYRSRSPEAITRDVKMHASARKPIAVLRSSAKPVSRTRNMDPTELERKRQEMMDSAREHGTERERRLRRHEEERRQEDTESKTRHKEDFLQPLRVQSLTSSQSVGERIQRKIHSVQRTNAKLTSNFMHK